MNIDHGWLWLISATTLITLEMFVPGVFLFWLGAGAAVTGGLALFFPEIGLEGQIVSLLLSCSTMVTIGVLWQKRAMTNGPQILNQGLAGFIGQSAIASQAFESGYGRVRIADSTFAAVCIEDGSNPVAGSRVTITGVADNELIVKSQTILS